MEALPQLFLQTKKSRRFDGFHPWVRERSIIEPTASIEPESVVELWSPGGGWIGRGVYNPHSQIRLRLYQWDRQGQLDQPWILRQLERSTALRQQWIERHGALDALRLVNSEGDGLSGLIVDRFGDYLVVQLTARAMLRWLDGIVAWLQSNLSPRGIRVRIEEKTAKSEGIEPRDEVERGEWPREEIEIQEHGVRLALDLSSGQKTGYYLDQRANRQRAARWARSGDLLDSFCYHGGFGLTIAQHALERGEALGSITAVDSSAPALGHARHNASLNGISGIEFVQADCFDFLESAVKQQRRFQTVVLDPPRMASNRAQVSAALRAYHRLNLAAVNLLEPDGILITCSCSGRISRSDFTGMLAAVAKRTRRSVQVVESSGADFDHPIDVNCPETEYLKCFICRVS